MMVMPMADSPILLWATAVVPARHLIRRPLQCGSFDHVAEQPMAAPACLPCGCLAGDALLSSHGNHPGCLIHCAPLDLVA